MLQGLVCSELLFKYVDFLVFQKKRFTKALYELSRFEEGAGGTWTERVIVTGLSELIA